MLCNSNRNISHTSPQPAMSAVNRNMRDDAPAARSHRSDALEISDDEEKNSRGARPAAATTTAKSETASSSDLWEEDEDEEFRQAIQASLHERTTTNTPSQQQQQRRYDALSPATASSSAAAASAAAAGSSALPVAALSSDGGVASQLLPFQAHIVRSLLREDGLVILGRGLGIQHVWLGFLARFLQVLPSPPPPVSVVTMTAGAGAAAASSASASAGPAAAASSAIPSAAPPSSASPHLIFLLNFPDEMIGWLNEQFQTYHHPRAAHTHMGEQAGGRSRGICAINNEYIVNERSALYVQGGLLAITSRILTVDLLNGVIACDLISGFCVHDAHSVNDSSAEAFILRIWRRANKVGWIKAMTDDAMACSRGSSGMRPGAAGGSSFGGLEVILKALFLRKVWLYPRFTISVNDSLNPPEDEGQTAVALRALQPPRARWSLDIIELHQPFSELMTGVQNALIEVIDTLITALKRENQHLAVYEHTAAGGSAAGGASVSASGSRDGAAATSRTLQNLNLSIEAGLLKNFESMLRAELNPIQHKLSGRTRSLMADLTALRSCIGYLINYDCITFYRYLLLIKSNAVNHPAGHSTWLLSDSADKLFKLAKQRLFVYQPALSKAAISALAAKRDKLQIKREKDAQRAEKKKIKAEAAAPRRSPTNSGSQTGASKEDAMELSSDDEAAEKASSKAQASLAASIAAADAAVATASSDSLHVVLEENPKWSLLLDTLEEIETDVCNRAQHFQQQQKERQLGDIMRGVGVGQTEGGVKSEAGATAASPSGPPLQLPPSFGRTLLLVRDTRTATFLTRLLSVGGRNLLRNYWKKYLFSLKLHKRNLNNAPPAAPSGWMAAAAAAAAAKAGAPAAPAPTAAAANQSAVYAQFQREGVLLKRELDGLMEEEHLERFRSKQQYANDLNRQRVQQREAKQREIDSEFDLGDADEKVALPAASKKACPAASAGVAASPTKANPYKTTNSIEALEREVDRLEEAEEQAAAVRPTLVFEPAAGAASTRGKRGAKAVADSSAAAAAGRKKAKKATAAPSDDAGGADAESALENDPADKAAPDADDMDADALLATEDDEKEGRDAAAAAAAAAGDSSSAVASAARAESSSTLAGSTSSFLFDRSDVSVIDANFRLGSIQQPAGTATTSPFFKAPTGVAQTARTVDLSPSSTAVTVLPAYQIMIHPLKGVHSVLHRFCPEYVLLFDPDIGVIRELEMFQAMPSTDWQLHVYFMLYSNSIEEQRYVSSIEQENKAFDSLIQMKKTMVIPIEQDGKLPEPSVRAETSEDRKNNSLYEDGTRNNTYEAYAATLPNKADTRRGGVQVDAPGTILVDVREFRSSLPSQLHAANLVIQPLTLEIADYILTPTLAVERKSVPDLIGSLASGRLYKQMEQAIRFYKTPVLLIEFDRTRPFLLQSKADLTGEISGKSVLSKLVLLMLHFPQMRILWSRDSHATTNLFLALKQRQQQPTIEQAVVASSHSIKSTQAGYEFVDVSAGSGLTEEEREAANLSLTPHDILRKLPGVTVNNIRGLLQNVSNLRELSECSLEQLAKWMGGMANAKKLHAFMHEEPRMA